MAHVKVHRTGSRVIGALLLTGALIAFQVVGTPQAVATDSQYWMDYNPSWRLSAKYSVGGDAGYRTETGGGSWNRFVLRPGVDIRHRNLTFKLGLGNFLTFYDETDDIWEIRPYQGVGWVWPRSAVDVDHLIRLEERFEIETGTWDSTNSVRSRYRLRLRYRFADPRPDRFWRAFGSGEIFLNLVGAEGLQQEQFRLTLGLERSWSLKFRLRFQTTWQQEEVFFLPNDTVDALYFRIRVYQNF